MTDCPYCADAAGKRAPVQGYAAGIPWSMHLRAYDAYCKEYGRQQALIEGDCRGGFGVGELDVFIPGWRDELSRLAHLEAENARLRAALKPLADLASTVCRSYMPNIWSLYDALTDSVIDGPTVGDCRRAAEAREGK